MMLVRLTKKAVETLEFRGLIVVLALLGAAILFLSVHRGHRAVDETTPPPTVPAGDPAPADRY